MRGERPAQLRLRLFTGILLLVAGILWLIDAVLRKYELAFVGAAIFLIAGLLFIVGWMRWRRSAKASRGQPSRPAI